jgi:hypothetical protein
MYERVKIAGVVRECITLPKDVGSNELHSIIYFQIKVVILSMSESFLALG